MTLGLLKKLELELRHQGIDVLREEIADIEKEIARLKVKHGLEATTNARKGVEI